MTKIIIGGSYVNNMDASTLFGSDYVNLGMAGCDNRTILNSLVEFASDRRISYAFVMFTGLVNTSYPVSKSLDKIFSKYPYSTINNQELRIFSGGSYGSWVNDRDVKGLFKPTYLLMDKIEHVIQNSLIDCMGTINFLKTNGIPFNYTFSYDPFSKDDDLTYLFGWIEKDNYYYSLLDKTNFIDKIFLYNLAKEKQLLRDDDVHPTQEAYEIWFHSIKNNLQKCANVL